ncbi:uncharacterized protein Dwil_GK28329 [Drosophila willistoni]|uniref:Peptidase S1 domain-containing protein n=1 Tax=Drosophila willistoni TaxID=7260 RepID=A0A0Q9WNZ7_DROWI|nr:melanization protease 1-like [Drosophila willistoni]KRF97590.1 uncharacterized protein Dwil_GK28329 [Drosophila willistoni]
MNRVPYYVSVLLNGIVLFELLSFNGEALAQQQSQLPQECGKLNETLFYNGQTETALNEYPWLGLLGYKEGNSAISYDCVAVLISQRYIIVPAHCITYSKANALSVVFGKPLTPSEKVYYLEEIVPHFQYNQNTYMNDIGLAKLKENVEFSDYVQPICLAPSNGQTDQYIGQRLELAGYVHNQERVFINTRIKAFVHSPSYEYCNEHRIIRSFDSSNKSQMCAYILGGRAFRSGSAVMGVNLIDGQPKSFYLIGILSFGEIKDHHPVLNRPMWFQRIAPFRDLIIQNMI